MLPPSVRNLWSSVTFVQSTLGPFLPPSGQLLGVNVFLILLQSTFVLGDSS